MDAVADTVKGAAKVAAPGWGEPPPLPSMAGKTAIVTGGNAGERPSPLLPSIFCVFELPVSHCPPQIAGSSATVLIVRMLKCAAVRVCIGACDLASGALTAWEYQQPVSLKRCVLGLLVCVDLCPY